MNCWFKSQLSSGTSNIHNKILIISSIILFHLIPFIINRIFVIDKNYRGKKYGSILLKEVIDIAKKLKCYKVILNCREDLCGFYQSQGFVKRSEGMAIYFQ